MRSVKIHKLDNKGLVSIIVTMILIIIMTLVVLAMSRNAIREQRQALDRQLSDQAFYNAESGINDWIKFINDNLNTSNFPNEKTRCDNTELSGLPGSVSIPPPLPVNNNIQYTCVLFDKTPESIVIDDLEIREGKTIPITSSSAIDRLVFEWDNNSGSNTVTGCTNSVAGERPTGLSGSCTIGGLRVDLVDPSSLSGPNSRDNLRNTNFISYFLPNNGNSSTNTINIANGRTPDNQGAVVVAHCDGGGCRAEITNVGLPAGNTLYLHIKSMYLLNDVIITPYNGSNRLEVIGAQYMLDVTGKSADVLRRVKVHVPAGLDIDIPDYALESGDSICKLISVNVDSSQADIDSSCL